MPVPGAGATVAWPWTCMERLTALAAGVYCVWSVRSVRSVCAGRAYRLALAAGTT